MEGKVKEKYVKLPEHILLHQIANTPEQLREYFRKEGREGVIKVGIGMIDDIIKLRNHERKTNNIYTKSNDELNDDFIGNLEYLKKEWECFKRKNG